MDPFATGAYFESHLTGRYQPHSASYSSSEHVFTSYPSSNRGVPYNEVHALATGGSLLIPTNDPASLPNARNTHSYTYSQPRLFADPKATRSPAPANRGGLMNCRPDAVFLSHDQRAQMRAALKVLSDPSLQNQFESSSSQRSASAPAVPHAPVRVPIPAPPDYQPRTPSQRLRGPADIDPEHWTAFRFMFPHVAEHVLHSVIDHSFRPDELYKLDSDPTRRGEHSPVVLHGPPSPADYPDLRSLIDPLSTYFRILLANPDAQDDRSLQFHLAQGSHSYIARLVELQGRYAWDAVLAYHFDFHRARQDDMRRRALDTWGTPDMDLQALHLVGRVKSASAGRPAPVVVPQPVRAHAGADQGRPTVAGTLAALAWDGETKKCALFNQDLCPSPCMYDQVHECQCCGSGEHSVMDCPHTRDYVVGGEAQWV